MTDDIKRGPGRPAKPELDPGMVKVRILPLGAGKVSDGKGGYKNEEGRIAYGKCAKGDELIVAQSVGDTLEARGYAEIL